MQIKNGFTLIELMIVVVIVAILTAIALPNYQVYMRKKDLSVAQQQALQIANHLERFKSKNFSYKGYDLKDDYPSYDAVNHRLLIPIGATTADAKFILQLVDDETKRPLNIQSLDGQETKSSQQITGLNWVIKIERQASSKGETIDPKQYDLLLRNKGQRCMTTTQGIVQDFTDCGTVDVKTW